MTRYFLGFHPRAFSFGLFCFGLAVVAPAGLKGFWLFMQSPPGGAIVALAIMAIGFSVEETGTVRRIRIGIGLRLVAVAVLVLSVIWAWSLGSPMSGLTTFAIVLCAAGSIGVGLAFQHDLEAFSDIRHGQLVRLLGISTSGIEIECNGEPVSISASDVLQAVPASNLDGRAVVFLVSEQARRRRNLDALPWIGSNLQGDAFVLTEHQAGMDVEDLMSQAIVMIAASRGGLGQ